MPQSPPLIVGAGPVGLAAALFLAEGGIQPRIIDKRSEPSPNSKALAVNPRTLDLLESTGVTPRLLATGKPMQGATFYRGGKDLAEVDFSQLSHQYPFMLALSQDATERMLTDALAQRGIAIERGVELQESSDLARGQAKLLHLSTGNDETIAAPWILAADGARSTARKALGIYFPGSSSERAWTLDDMPLESPFAADRAHIHFLDDGFLVMIPVVNGREAPGDPPVWRLIANRPDPISLLPSLQPRGESRWNSSFHVAHRMVEKLTVGQCHLAGDAAHLHSPIGARGMNLGIEDAWTFAQLALRNELARYHTLRWKIDHAVVRRIGTITWVVRGESTTSRLIRHQVMPRALRLPPIRRQMLAAVTGLDHAVALD